MELLGLLLPILIDLINRRVADSDIRLWTSVLVCALFGVFINYLNTQFTFLTPLDAFNSIAGSILVVFGLAQISFKALWEKTDTHKTLKNDSLK